MHCRYGLWGITEFGCEFVLLNVSQELLILVSFYSTGVVLCSSFFFLISVTDLLASCVGCDGLISSQVAFVHCYSQIYSLLGFHVSDLFLRLCSVFSDHNSLRFYF